MAKIDDIDVNGLSFDLKDKKAAYASARKLAFQDAARRASDYASAAGVKLGTTVAVTDSYYSTYFASSSVASGPSTPSSTISVGKVVVNYNVGVTYAFS